MRTRRTAFAVLFLTATLLVGPLVACGSDEQHAAPSSSVASTTPLNPYEQQRYDGVTALLDQLSATLTAGDRNGLAPLIDDAATPAFRRHFAVIAANFAANKRAAVVATSKGRHPAKTVTASPLKVREFRFRVAPENGPEHLLEDDVRARLDAQGATDTWVTPVDLEYALGGSSVPGLDEPTVTLHRSFAFARYGDEWKLVGDGNLAPDPTALEGENPNVPDRGLWEFPGLAATDVKTAGGTSTVLFYSGAEKAAATVSDLLAGAVDEVRDFWGDGWVRRAAVVATASDEQFAGLTRTAPGDTAAAAAATVFTLVDKQKKQVVGQRIVLTPAARTLPEPALAVVVRHELVHVAARLVTAEGAPLWLTEGVPEYVGRKGTYRDFVDAAPELAAAVAAKQVPKALPSDGAFSVDSDAARIAYQSAWSFAAFVADRFGDQKLKDMYVKIARGGDTATQDAAMKEALGVDKKSVVADWQKWLRKQVR